MPSAYRVRGRLAWRLACGAALLGILALAGRPVQAEGRRYAELKRVIDRNTGFAHMTRGMNMYTLIALRGCVSEGDIPVLGAMLRDQDHVTQLSAANVLLDMGEPGKQALRQGLETARAAGDTRTRLLLEEALREADSPSRRPILDYPLTERERREIRGCEPRR